MRSFWSDPYLWVHLAGAAAVPLFLEFCLLGLGVGSPLRPVGLEFALVGTIGVAPVLWMQWQKPFSIFSLVVLALKPDQLTIDQRRILKLFKAPLERVVAVLTAITLLAVLWQLYQIAPIASEVTPFGRFGRLGGVLVAAIAFLGCNLFLQIPVSVLRVLFTSEKQFFATEPYSVEKIAQDFTLSGLQIQQILPTIQAQTEIKPEAKLEAKPEAEPEAEPEEATPEIEAAALLEEVAIAGVTPTITLVEPTVDLADSPEDPLDEFGESKDFSEPLSETIPEITSEIIPEAIAEPISETIHIIELELIDDSEAPYEAPYVEVMAAEEEIIVVEESMEEETIEIEIQYVPDEITIDSSAEGAIEESNWEEDDWEE